LSYLFYQLYFYYKTLITAHKKGAYIGAFK